MSRHYTKEQIIESNRHGAPRLQLRYSEDDTVLGDVITVNDVEDKLTNDDLLGLLSDICQETDGCFYETPDGKIGFYLDHGMCWSHAEVVPTSKAA